jgi:hypothetical protein
MRKILYILKHNPWDIGGGCYVSAAYLNAFTELFQTYQIDLCLCEEYITDINVNLLKQYNVIPVKERTLLSKIFSFLSGRLHRHTFSVKKLLKQNSDYEYCIFDHSAIAGSLVKHINGLGIKTITIHHNYEPAYFQDNTNNPILKKLILPQVIKNEKIAFRHTTYNLFLTKENCEIFNRTYGNLASNSYVIGSFESSRGNSLSEFKQTKEKGKKLTFIITGSLSNVQNIDGIRYFFNELYSLIPKKYKIIIAGKNPTIEIVNLAKKYTNIVLIPNPKNMLDVLKLADIYICPARLGSGIKVRIMDGLRLGLPVITHEVASRGYEVFKKNKFLVSFSTKEEFKIELTSLISMILSNQINTNRIQELYLNDFSFESGVSRLKEAIIDNYE